MKSIKTSYWCVWNNLSALLIIVYGNLFYLFYGTWCIQVDCWPIYLGRLTLNSYCRFSDFMIILRREEITMGLGRRRFELDMILLWYNLSEDGLSLRKILPNNWLSLRNGFSRGIYIVCPSTLILNFIYNFLDCACFDSTELLLWYRFSNSFFDIDCFEGLAYNFL